MLLRVMREITAREPKLKQMAGSRIWESALLNAIMSPVSRLSRR